MKTVQVLGASYQEKVQPSVDELDYNSEEYYSDASSAIKIGKLKNLCNGKSAMLVGCGYKDELKYRQHKRASS